MTKTAENQHALVLAWDAEFEEKYIDKLIAALEYATEHGSVGQAVEAKAELEAFHKYLEAKRDFIRRKLENHLVDGLETAVKRFSQTSELP